LAHKKPGLYQPYRPGLFAGWDAACRVLPRGFSKEPDNFSRAGRAAGTATKKRRLNCRSPQAGIAHLSDSNIDDANGALQEPEELSSGKSCAYRRKLWKNVENSLALREFAVIIGQLARVGVSPIEESRQGRKGFHEARKFLAWICRRSCSRSIGWSGERARI
jgi:hypothetical protein